MPDSDKIKDSINKLRIVEGAVRTKDPDKIKAALKQTGFKASVSAGGPSEVYIKRLSTSFPDAQSKSFISQATSASSSAPSKYKFLPEEAAKKYAINDVYIKAIKQVRLTEAESPERGFFGTATKTIQNVSTNKEGKQRTTGLLVAGASIGLMAGFAWNTVQGMFDLFTNLVKSGGLLLQGEGLTASKKTGVKIIPPGSGKVEMTKILTRKGFGKFLVNGWGNTLVALAVQVGLSALGFKIIRHFTEKRNKKKELEKKTQETKNV